ncbi:MAG TPA: hypothetical protein GXX75_02265 [Clostridiales bacterium]|nr:hypothetical protein [Clostridiales bacterium]
MNIDNLKTAMIISLPFIIWVLLIIATAVIISFTLYKSKRIKHNTFGLIFKISLALLILSVICVIGYYMIFDPAAEINIQVMNLTSKLN